MISDHAVRLMEETAESVGFGYRPDYPHLGASPLSVGDWKGSSIAACVFADRTHAEAYLDKCLSVLDALGGGLRGDVLTVVLEIGHTMYIAVLTATDLVAASEISDDDNYGPEVHPTPAEILDQNSRDPRPPTAKQLHSLRGLCAKKGITESHLIELGVQEGRLSPRHAEGSDAADLNSLTRSEIGGLFAFGEWLKQG